MIFLETSFYIYIGTRYEPTITKRFQVEIFFDLDYNHLIWLYSVWKFRWLKMLCDYYHQFYDIPF